MEPKNLALDGYVLSQARAEVPRILFIPTASGDSDSYIAKFYAAFSGLPCKPQHLPLFRSTGSLRETVLSHDVLSIGAGNTRSYVLCGVWAFYRAAAAS
jgi:dipeptidase E